jgi:nucleolar pre-ribosomal-associated protein 1
MQDVTFHERDQLLYVLTLLQHAVPDPASATTTDNTSTSESSGANGFVRSWDGPTPSAPSVPAPPRLPTMTTLFLAYHLHSLGSPSHFLYPITSRFLLQRPVLDLYDPPMLYALLYGSDRGPRGELPSMQEVRRGRGWIVRLIRDGTRSEVVRISFLRSSEQYWPELR